MDVAPLAAWLGSPTKAPFSAVEMPPDGEARLDRDLPVPVPAIRPVGERLSDRWGGLVLHLSYARCEMGREELSRLREGRSSHAGRERGVDGGGRALPLTPVAGR